MRVSFTNQYLVGGNLCGRGPIGTKLRLSSVTLTALAYASASGQVEQIWESTSVASVLTCHVKMTALVVFVDIVSDRLPLPVEQIL